MRHQDFPPFKDMDVLSYEPSMQEDRRHEPARPGFMIELLEVLRDLKSPCGMNWINERASRTRNRRWPSAAIGVVSQHLRVRGFPIEEKRSADAGLSSLNQAFLTITIYLRLVSSL